MEGKTIDAQVAEQEKKNTKIREDNSTDAERVVYNKLKKILEHFRANIFPEKFEEVKAKLLYSKEYEHSLKQHKMPYKSAKIYPLIASVHDTFMDSLYDNDLRPKVFPMDKVDAEKVDNTEKFFQRWVEISETEDTLEVVRNEAALVWASYWIPWYNTSIMTDDNGEDKTIFIPALFPVSFFEMFYSVWATDFYKAPEKFRRRFMAFNQLKYAFWPIWDDMEIQVKRKKSAILDAPMPLSQADFTKIYDIESYSERFLWILWDGIADWMTYDKTFNVIEGSSFCEVVDLYIGDQLMVFVNGYSVYSGTSPFYYWEDFEFGVGEDWPFLEITFERKKWTVPVGIASKLKWHQKQCNALYNSISDAMYRHLNPILAVVQWAITDPTTANAPTTIAYEEWKTYSINPSYAGMNPISKLDFTDYNILSLSINYFESVKADAYNIIWVNSYVLWWEGKVERSRYGAEQKVNAAKSRLSPMVKSIGRFYSKLFYHWLWLSKLSWASVSYIKDEDGKEYIIDLSQLQHKFKIVCSAETSVEETKASKVQWLLTMQQNLAWVSQNPITGLSDIDNWALLTSITDYAGLRWFKPMTVEEQKAYVDKAYEVKDYIQQKEMELQSKMQPQVQQAQPTNQQWAQPSDAEVAAMLQAAWANQQQPSPEMNEGQLDYTFAQ